MDKTSPKMLIRSLNAGYGAVQILKDIRVSLGSEEIVAVLGPNGSGKSTLIKSIMGLTTIYGGEVEWDGEEILRLRPHQRAEKGLGYVPQTENVFPALSVQENLEMGGFLLSGREMSQNIKDAYALFPSLYDRRRIRAGSLSGGERRMLAIASCMMIHPRCLLLDEPSSDLAPAMIDLVFERINVIRSEYRIPILMVEQNVPRAMELAERLYVLVQGSMRLEADVGTVSESELCDLFLEVSA
jgi:ABC-type branched-subunit amino acid transport system ATPase component